MTRKTSEIAIIGGGICGLVTALALEQRGLSPTVYEAAVEYRPIGAGLLLQTNALLVLNRLGIADRVRDTGVALDDSVIQSPSGRVLKRFDLNRLERDEFGYGFVAIHRADLQAILLDELATDVETGMKCHSVSDTHEPTVQFSDGSHIRPDVIVGADGINSTVRDAVAPDVELEAIDSVAYRAVTTVDLPEKHQTRGVEIWGNEAYSGGAPLGDDRFYWFGTAPGSLANGQVDHLKTVAELRKQLAAYPEPIPTVLDSLGEDDIFVTALNEVPTLNQWYQGSVCLAGDAAHAMLPFAGQGAAQAIEDGLLLAHLLSATDVPSEAFKLYEQKRKPRADRIRSESHLLGRLGSIQSQIGSRTRNLAVELVPDVLFQRARRQRASCTPLP
ncbi:FAD-dependent monooxygenase [Haloprofundus salilacus]|uniref:FAD-dependent monooxygenase n=1 Tax=Haloprofundus salilacus TaxID=2876190 RepID=UPI001CCC7837|nr:FAD-dependent monooxygenase [Haloprofundus salilacus]